MSDITINIQNKNKSVTSLVAPTDMSLSLMEFLKGNDYDIMATCGGMALCATCHVKVLCGYDDLYEISNEEYEMLDRLPNMTETSRLSCQIKLAEHLDGLTVELMGDGIR